MQIEKLNSSFLTTVHTSTAYSVRNNNWTEQQNIQTYGEYASAEGMGCNFQVDGKVYGLLSESEKQAWAKKLKEASLLIDHKFLNKDVEYFKDKVPSLENIAQFLYENIRSDNAFELRVYEGPKEFVEVGPYGIRYSQEVSVSCVHKHWNPDYSAEENKNIYGKCSGLHGHEYKVIATVAGSVDKESGWLISRQQMRKILDDEIVNVFHGKFLNDFLGNTSGEKITMQFYEILKKQFLTHSLCRLVVKETRKNSFYIGVRPF